MFICTVHKNGVEGMVGVCIEKYIADVTKHNNQGLFFFNRFFKQ